MAKRQSGSSARGRRAGKNARPIPDNQIDFSDIPQSTDEELRRARRVVKPNKCPKVVALMKIQQTIDLCAIWH